MLRVLLLSLVAFNSFTTSESGLIQIRECEAFSPNLADQYSPTKLLERNAKEQLTELSFKYDVLKYRENNDETRIIDIVPDIAFPVKNGWLLSVHFDRMNGSALVFKKNNGEIQTIIDDYIEDIYKFPYGYVVTAGYSHTGHSSGSIYLVTKKSAAYVAEKIHGLIAKPITSWLTSNGELLINHRDNASSVFTPSGNLYRVSCTNLTSE